MRGGIFLARWNFFSENEGWDFFWWWWNYFFQRLRGGILFSEIEEWDFCFSGTFFSAEWLDFFSEMEGWSFLVVGVRVRLLF